MGLAGARLLGAAAIGLALAGCLGATRLDGRLDGVRDVVTQAERNGAYRCAPRALAMAKAHLAFAESELRGGEPLRAEEHYRVAEPNARAAYALSPADRCAPRRIEVRPPVQGDRDGDGVPDAEDGCISEAEDVDGFEDEDGCPDDQDVDGDGIPASRDQCALEPEDPDGYLDADGCPEPDNDLDGIADDADQCALDPEDRDGYRDDDGCPDLDNDADSIRDTEDACPDEPGPAGERGCPRAYQDVEVTRTAIRIHEKIHFDVGRSTIRSVSFPILNTVAQVLVDYPEMRLEIGGHTDSRGPDAANLRLSQARADAVLEHLVGRGIDRSRLVSRGFGEGHPIESNHTNSGRATNRRVEFNRTDPAASESP